MEDGRYSCVHVHVRLKIIFDMILSRACFLLDSLMHFKFSSGIKEKYKISCFSSQ